MKGLRDDEELMMFHDGELAPREARTAEERAAGSKPSQAKIEAMKQIGDVIRARYDAVVDEAGPKLDALWGKLERQLGEPEAVEKRSIVGAIREWFETYRAHVLTGAVCATAAAILVFFLGRKTETQTVYVDRPAPVAPSPPSPAPVPPEPPQLHAAAEDAEVESLEVSGGTGTVMHIPGDDDEGATTVIWITREAPSGSEGPI